MSKFQTVLLAIIAFAVAGALYKFVPSAGTVSAALAALGIWLTGYAKTHSEDKARMTDDERSTQGGHGSIVTFILSAFVGLAVLVGVVVHSSGCAWWQRHEKQFECAAVETIENGGQLLEIVVQCQAIAVTPAAILPCIRAAANSEWIDDVQDCFLKAAQGKASCPAYQREQTARAARLARVGQ